MTAAVRRMKGEQKRRQRTICVVRVWTVHTGGEKGGECTENLPLALLFEVYTRKREGACPFPCFSNQIMQDERKKRGERKGRTLKNSWKHAFEKVKECTNTTRETFTKLWRREWECEGSFFLRYSSPERVHRTFEKGHANSTRPVQWRTIVRERMMSRWWEREDDKRKFNFPQNFWGARSVVEGFPDLQCSLFFVSFFFFAELFTHWETKLNTLWERITDGKEEVEDRAYKEQYEWEWEMYMNVRTTLLSRGFFQSDITGRYPKVKTWESMTTRFSQNFCLYAEGIEVECVHLKF